MVIPSSNTFESIEKYKKTRDNCAALTEKLRTILNDKIERNLYVDDSKYPITNIGAMIELYLKSYEYNYGVMSDILPYIVAAINKDMNNILKIAITLVHEELYTVKKAAAKDAEEILFSLR